MKTCRSQFDKDTRDLVQVKLVHGSWREEDLNRIGIEVSRWFYISFDHVSRS